jgi:hypothetical protein
MVSFASIPTIGYNDLGKPINMIATKENNRTIASTNASAVGKTQSTTNPVSDPTKPWNVVTVDAVYSDGSKSVVIGLGQKLDGGAEKLIWSSTSGQWEVASVTNLGTIKSEGIAKAGSEYLMVDSTSSKVYRTTFNIQSPSPAGGLSKNSLTKLETVSSGKSMQGLSINSSVTVGYSPSTVGTWINTGDIFQDGNWTRNLGEVELVKTNHKSTSYTFPGYAGSTPTIKRINAIPLGDIQPQIWNIDPNSEKAKGYYGIVDSPTLTVTWAK